MKTTSQSYVSAKTCRTVMLGFWDTMTAAEDTPAGVVMALPICYPDGWQIVVQLQQISERRGVISDRGRTLMKLQETGVSVERRTKGTHEILEKRKKAFGIIQEGYELKSEIHLPLDGAEIQLFAESLLSLAYLSYRREVAEEIDLATLMSVRRIFQERQVRPRENYSLDGAIEKRIHVDFYLDGKTPLAVEAVKRRGQILGYMEQWAWRWTDIKRARPGLVRAMVYDPDQQEWDRTSLDIGKQVCDLFCPYFERAAIDDLIGKCA